MRRAALAAWASIGRGAGIRFLLRRRGGLATAVLTMALALGANTAVFSTVQAFLLSSLAVPEPDRLFQVAPIRELPGRGPVVFAEAWPNYQLLRETHQVFAEVAAVLQGTVSWDDGGEARPLRSTLATASWFPTVRVSPILGRPFTAEEEGPNPAAVVVIGHSLWQASFGADPEVIGRIIHLNGEPFTVVGVMPEGFDQPVSTDVWLPFDIPAVARVTISGGRNLQVLARLADGVAPDAGHAAAAELTRRAVTADSAANAPYVYELQTLRQSLLAGADATVLLVQSGAALLLLLAVFNMASLMMAWGFERQQEIAIRRALGARGLGITLLLVAQASVVVGVGALIGSGFAAAAIWAIRQVDLGPALGFFLTRVELDTGVLLATAAAAIAAGIMSGLVPALFARRGDLATTLRPGSRSVTLSPAALRWQKGMVMTQAAVSVVILAAAATVAVSFRNLLALPDGFDAPGRVVARVQLPAPRYATHLDRVGFADRLRFALEQQPELSAHGFVSTLPVVDQRSGNNFFVEHPLGGLEAEPMLFHIRRTAPSYLATMGIPLLEGRHLTAGDDADAPLVAVISHALARRLAPAGGALGLRFFRPGSPSQPIAVVGVVGNVMDGGYGAGPGEAVYIPYAQQSTIRISIVARGRTTPDAALAAINRAVRAADPLLATTGPATLESLVRQANALPRLRTLVLAVFALVAMGIVALGSYGVLSQLVATREREFLIRLAHGAAPTHLGRAVLAAIAWLTVPGIGLGVLMSWGIGEAIRPFLYGIDPGSVRILAGVGAATILLAIGAGLPSVRRAMRLDVRRIQGG